MGLDIFEGVIEMILELTSEVVKPKTTLGRIAQLAFWFCLVLSLAFGVYHYFID